MPTLGFVLLYVIIFAVICGRVGLIVYRAKSDSEYRFSCPNCGRFFRLNWKKLIPVSITHRLRNYVWLRCPYCNQKDQCKIHYDDEL